MDTDLTVLRVWIDGKSSRYFEDMPKIVKNYNITPKNIISVVHEGNDVVIYYWGKEEK